ncbi:hypothetical protein [Diaminobutyricibacter sp. McL0608]|uniref:PH-like domain-containing protein n=1 Tax=Leifsonia sp. McL0608 TaxID=3143537 RepID=UPI0031F303CE
MDKLVPTLVAIAVVALILYLLIFAWRRRAKRDAGLGAGYDVPADAAVATHDTDTLYVATTPHDKPLERLVLPNLGFRGKATVSVAPDGVTLAITGADLVFIRASALLGVGLATWAIDRVVETDGLVWIAWTTSGGAAVDSYIRVIDPAERSSLIGAVNDILPASVHGQTPAAHDSTGSEQTNEREV